MPDDIEQPPRGYTTDDVKAIPDEEPEPRRRRRLGWKSILAGLVIILVIGVGLWTWISLNWAYSDGERVGYVQKFSRKGWLCKTWEGELAMANVPGSMPQLFHFTVRDDAVAQLLVLGGQVGAQPASASRFTTSSGRAYPPPASARRITTCNRFARSSDPRPTVSAARSTQLALFAFLTRRLDQWIEEWISCAARSTMR